jgi:SulP family sulfate permease
VRYLVLRLKRVRNPDVVCVERLEHFLKEAQREGLNVLLAGLRAEFLVAIDNVHFSAWYPDRNIFPEADEDYSATLRAVRHAYAELGDANTCEHCGARGLSVQPAEQLYYLV